jgi:hypothetical protein
VLRLDNSVVTLVLSLLLQVISALISIARAMAAAKVPCQR